MFSCFSFADFPKKCRIFLFRSLAHFECGANQWSRSITKYRVPLWKTVHLSIDSITICAIKTCTHNHTHIFTLFAGNNGKNIPQSCVTAFEQRKQSN